MSTDEQEDSPLTQGHHTEEFIARSGCPPWTRAYFDLGISGGELAKRPGMLALLRDSEALKPAVIVFYKLDRAFRNSFEQSAALRRLKKLGIRVLKVRDPNIDGPQGELIDTILGGVNQFERELVGLRIRDHNQAMAERGEWPGGPAPFGYRYRKPVKAQSSRKPVVVEPGGLDPHPEDWPVARQLWDWALAGQKPAEILDLAAQAGYRRRNGGHWTFAALTRLFTSRVYAGYVPFGHHVPGKHVHTDTGTWHHGQHTPLVTAGEFARVQSLLRQGNPRQRRTRNPRMELGGIIRCGICGSSVGSASVTRDGGYLYTCLAAARKEADHPYWSRRDWLIHMALQTVIDRAVWSLPTQQAPVTDQRQRQRIGQEIARLQTQLARLRELYVLGEYEQDIGAYQERKAALQAQVAARQADLESTGPDAGQLRARHRALTGWGAAYQGCESVPDRQRLWRAVIEQVECDGRRMRVRLQDLGPDVPREWLVELPPPRSRLPGTRNGRGVVGQALDGRYRGRIHGMVISPVPTGAGLPGRDA